MAQPVRQTVSARNEQATSQSHRQRPVVRRRAYVHVACANSDSSSAVTSGAETPASEPSSSGRVAGQGLTPSLLSSPLREGAAAGSRDTPDPLPPFGTKASRLIQLSPTVWCLQQVTGCDTWFFPWRHGRRRSALPVRHMACACGGVYACMLGGTGSGGEGSPPPQKGA